MDINKKIDLIEAVLGTSFSGQDRDLMYCLIARDNNIANVIRRFEQGAKVEGWDACRTVLNIADFLTTKRHSRTSLLRIFSRYCSVSKETVEAALNYGEYRGFWLKDDKGIYNKVMDKTDVKYAMCAKQCLK